MKDQHRCRNNFILGALLGLLVFVAVYGVEVLNPVHVEWLRHSNDLEGLWDLSQHYFGWVLYRRTPWRFPIGLLEGLSPEPLSIVYTDSIPLLAVVCKLLSPVLPADFQYFGMFELLSYMLLGGFGSLVTARCTKSGWINGLSALFFLISPVLTKRVFYHSALSAHFLLLMAICLWLYRSRLSQGKYLWLWVGVTVLATGINAYYLPMVLGILGISELERVISGGRIRHTLPRIAATGSTALLCGYCLGMFYGRVSPSAENIEDVSFNLLGLVNPRNEMLTHLQEMPLFSFEDMMSYSRFFGGFANFTPWQNEGFSYLGLGVLAGLALAVVWMIWYGVRHRFTIVPGRPLVIALVTGAVIFLFLALGPRATLGGWVLYHIPWPASVYQVLSIFRTAGRLIWPVYYGLLSLMLLWFARGYERAAGKKTLWLALLAVLFLVQLWDVSPSLAYKHGIYATLEQTPYENELMENAAISALGDEAEEILFVAPTQAIRLRPYWSTLFEDFAIQKGLRMNGAYCSRDTTEAADAYANEVLQRRQAGERFPGVIYVFLTEDILRDTDTTGLSILPYKDIFIATEQAID